MACAAARPAEDDAVLTLRVAGEALAVPAADVSEIIRPPPWTRVPHGPASLLGLANLRGTVFPVVSLAVLLGRTVGTVSPASRVVVLAGAAPVGLLVDAVSALAKAAGGRVLDPAALLAGDFGTLLRRGPVRPDIPREAGPTPGNNAGADVLALIGLRIAGQEYGLPLDRVAEVLRLPAAPLEVPRTGDATMGVTAFRGGLLPLVSLRVLLGLPAGEHGGSARRVVVTSLDGAPVGLVVDGVTSTMAIPAGSIDPVPAVLMRGMGEAQIEGICRVDGGRRLICILSHVRLFDRQTASRIRSQANEETSSMSGPEALGGAVEQFVVFRLGQEQYGLPVAAVDEVARRPEGITRLPHAPDFVEGVVNLRGRVVPLIDARKRFGAGGEHGPWVANGGRRVIVVTMDGVQAGFVVDAVSEVLSVPASELQQAPEFETGRAPLFDRVAIERGGRMILLISPTGLLQQAERDLLASLSETGLAEEPAAS